MADLKIEDSFVQSLVEQAVQDRIISAIDNLSSDPVWLAKIEHMVNQAMVQRVVAQLSTIDINSIVNDRVTEFFNNRQLENFSSSGISDRAAQTQLTIMDEVTVFENELTARDLTVVGAISVKDLVVKGSINTDNQSWQALARAIKDQTLAELTDSWHDRLVDDVANQIKTLGIDFDQVTVNGLNIIEDNALNPTITTSNLRSVGTLDTLTVSGSVNIGSALAVTSNRVGVNTSSPDSALSVWDEETNVIVGKHKSQESFIGTGKAQTLNLGTNREPQLTITPDGLTSVKKFSIQQHRIGFDIQVPGWAGTRGDVVFNSNPTTDVFAWVCLGDYKWKALKAAV